MTTLVILVIMSLMLLTAYQTLISVETLLSSDSMMVKQYESIRDIAIKLSRQGDWPKKCYLQSNQTLHACQVGHYHYLIEQKNPNRCAVINSQGELRDALFFHLWIWQESQPLGYFVRFVKPAQSYNCRYPAKIITKEIQSESIHAVKFNIRDSAK